MRGNNEVKVGRILRERNKKRVIEALMKGEARLGEIVERSGVNRRTVSRCLKELMSEGLVVKDHKKRTYRLASLEGFEKFRLRVNPGLLLYLLSFKIRGDAETLASIEDRDKYTILGRHYIECWMKILEFSLLVGYIFEHSILKYDGYKSAKRITVNKGIGEVLKALDSFLERNIVASLRLLLLYLNDVADHLYELGFKDVDEIYYELLNYVKSRHSTNLEIEEQ